MMQPVFWITIATVIVVVASALVIGAMRPTSIARGPSPGPSTDRVWCPKQGKMVPRSQCPCRAPSPSVSVSPTPSLIWCPKQGKMVPRSQCPCRAPSPAPNRVWCPKQGRWVHPNDCPCRQP